MQGTKDGQRLRLAASGMAAAAVLAFALVSVTNLISAWGLQHALDHHHTLERLRGEWAQALIELPEPALRQRAEQSLGRELSFIALRDLGGVVLASAGRFENSDLDWLPGTWRQGARSLLYRLSSQTGRTPLTHQGQPVGSLDYALPLSLPQQVHDEAVSRLTRSSWLGLLLSLAAGAALLWLYRRAPDTADRQLVQRLQTPVRREAPKASTPSLPEPLGFATLDCDADGRVLRLSPRAETLTGWTQTDAQGLPVGSVFQLHDERGLPQPVLAATALRTREATALERGALRARNGSFTPIEAQAAPTEQGASLVFRDTQREASEREALAREARLSQGVIDHLDEGLLTTDPAGVVRSANARALRMFGYAPGELAGVTVTKLLPVPFLNTPGVKLADYIPARDARRLPRVVGWRKDATTFQAELEVQPLNAGEDSGLIVILRDITERLRGENLALRLGRLLDGSPEEIYIFDAQSLYFLEVNRSARKSLGYSAAELAKLTPLSLCPDLGSDAFHAHLARLRSGETEALSYPALQQRADGSRYAVEVRLHFSRDEEPPVFLAIARRVEETAPQPSPGDAAHPTVVALDPARRRPS